MAQLTLKQLLESKTTDAPQVNPPKNDGVFGINGTRWVNDVVSSEASPNGPRVQLYKNLPSIYSTSLPIIESQGSIDPGRTMAVKAAHYNSGKGSLLGGGLRGVLGNLLGGSANRPSDTIFILGNQEGASGIDALPPVSVNGQPINGDYSGLKYAVKPGEYYAVSKAPAGTNAFTGLLKGTPEDIAKRAVGAATDEIKKGVRNLAVGALTSKRKTAIGDLKDRIKQFENLGDNSYYYNTRKDNKIGKYYFKSSGKEQPNLIPKMANRIEGNITDSNDIITEINKVSIFDDEQLKELVKINKKTKLQYIQFKVVGQSNYLIFPATISELSEDITSDIADFKYVGSPFKVYRYNGVERTLKFNFQVYWLDNGEQEVMKRKLDNLRELAFPSTNLKTIDIGIPIGNNKNNPLVFSPNLIQLTIGDLYKNLKGIISNLSIGVEQKTTWATNNPDFQKPESLVYPNVVDISFEMKIIENHKIKQSEQGGTITYRFTEDYETAASGEIRLNQDFGVGGGIRSAYGELVSESEWYKQKNEKKPSGIKLL
jgi:hypothetical protein